MTRKIQRGAGIELLEFHNLASHPGLLVNLSLIQQMKGHSFEAKQTLMRALACLPNHPHLSAILQAYEGKTD